MMLATIFFHSGLFAPPPQILVRSMRMPKLLATSSESLSPYTTPSSTAWVISSLLVSMVMPIKHALALGSLWGERSPMR